MPDFGARMVGFKGELRLKITRRSGRIENLGIVSSDTTLTQPVGFWRALWRRLRREAKIPATMGFFAFLAWMLNHQLGAPGCLVLALVTNGGVDFMSNNFANQGAGFNVGNFNFHESGTNGTAATVAQTDLLGKLSIARVSGTQVHPALYTFQSQANVAYSSTLTLAEWGLFSAAGAGLPPVGGTLWDRRVISPTAGVNNGDSVQFQYNCLATSGGS